MYICSACNCFLANKKNNTYKCPPKEGYELNFLTFSNIDNYKEDQYKRFESFTHLYCSFCEQQIGMRMEKDYSLYKSKLTEASGQLNIAVYSLKEELFSMIQKKIDKQIASLSFCKLLKKELNNIPLQKNIHAAIIIHQIESRVLLLGKNGLYNDLAQKLWKQTCGNVILLLYDQNNKDQEDTIQNLAIQGEQPQIAELYQAQQLLFLTNEIDLNNVISKFAAKSYNKCFPVEIIRKEEDVSEEKYLLLTYYYEAYKQLDFPNSDQKLMLSLIKKSRKQLQFDCIIQ